MNPLENFRMAFDSLWTNKLRSILALLGIVIGVFAVTAMISLGEMAQLGINNSLESVAGRSVFVQPDFNGGSTQESAPIRDEEIRLLQTLPATVIPTVFTSGQYESKPGERKAITLQGSPGDMPKLDPTTKIAQGRYFSAGEANGGAAVVVLSDTAAKDIYPKQNPIGKVLRIFAFDGSRVDLNVVGVLQPPAGAFGGLGATATAYTSNNFLWSNWPGQKRGTYTFVTLALNKNADAKRVTDQVTQIYESRFGKGKYSVQSTESFQDVFKVITSILQVLLGGTAALSLFVGGIGIMNIMLVSVTERTREIGLRKAMGATAGLIRQQFLIEAIVLTMLGGLIGVVGAIGLLLIISLTVPFLSSFSINPVTILIALTVSIAIGLIFGVLPAARAAKLDPIEALRYE